MKYCENCGELYDTQECACPVCGAALKANADDYESGDVDMTAEMTVLNILNIL